MMRILMTLALLATTACGPAGTTCTAEVTEEGASGYTYHQTTVYRNAETGTVRSCKLHSEGPAGHVATSTTCMDVTDPSAPEPFSAECDPCSVLCK